MEYSWLYNENWKPEQSQIAVSFYPITQYDIENRIGIEIVEKKALSGDLNANYVKNAVKEASELNEILSKDEIIDIYKKYFELSKLNQLNSKEKIISLYTDSIFDNGITYYDLLKEITGYNDKKLKIIIEKYYVETINNGYAGGIKSYISFMFNNREIETMNNSFNFDMYHKDLRSVERQLNKDFYDIIIKTFNKNHDGYLLGFMMQIYAFGLNGSKDLEKVCLYANSLENTEFSKNLVYKEIVRDLKKNNIKCSGELESIEWELPLLNSWYSSWISY